MSSRLRASATTLRSTVLLLVLCLIVTSCGSANTGTANTGIAVSTETASVLATPTAVRTGTASSFATPAGLPGQPLTPYPGKPGEDTLPTPFPAQSPAPVTPMAPGGDPGFANIEIPPYTPPPTPRPEDPFNMVINAGYAPSSIADSTANADLVVSGTVMEVLPPRWTTPDGSRPANPHDQSKPYSILTPHRIQVEVALKGKTENPILMVSTIGGTIGADSVLWGSDNDQILVRGERVVLFLNAPRPSTGLAAIDKQVVWHLTTRFTITPDGLATNSYTSMPLPQLLGEIAAAQKR